MNKKSKYLNELWLEDPRELEWLGNGHKIFSDTKFRAREFDDHYNSSEHLCAELLGARHRVESLRYSA